jgi:hypothetical protein
MGRSRSRALCRATVFLGLDFGRRLVGRRMVGISDVGMFGDLVGHQFSFILKRLPTDLAGARLFCQIGRYHARFPSHQAALRLAASMPAIFFKSSTNFLISRRRVSESGALKMEEG